MRNAGRVGFLNSPNRMNVATTRAREWRIIGRYDYFSGQGMAYTEKCDEMLIAFAKAHDKVTLKELTMKVKLNYTGTIDVYDVNTTYAASMNAPGLQRLCKWAELNGGILNKESMREILATFDRMHQFV